MPKANANSKLDQLLSNVNERAAELGVAAEAEPYSLEWYRADWPARKQEFIEREIKIRNAFDKNQLVPFTLNDAQKTLLAASNQASEDGTENYTLKCRRLGISTYYCADYLADAIIESGHHIRIVAQDPHTLAALFRVVKTMYSNLRDEIKPEKKYNSINSLEFNDPEKGVVESKFSVSTVSPGEEEKGRGDTITRLHLTEIPFWKGDAEMAATALCDATKGGKISGESTAKGVGDWFHRKYVQGRKHEGGVQSHFFEWWWNDNYQLPDFTFEIFGGDVYLIPAKDRGQLHNFSDEDLAKARVSDYTAEEQRERNLAMQSEMSCADHIATHLYNVGEISVPDTFDDAVARRLAWRRKEIVNKKEKKFRVEYPENDVDPFAQTGGAIFEQTYTHVTVDPAEPKPGASYIVACDPSIGIEGSGDPAVITVIDRHSGDQVYSWQGFEKQDGQGKRCCDLSDRYFGADIVVESNMGEGVIIEIENRGYEHRLYKYIDVQTQRDVDSGKVSMRDAMQRARPGLPMTEKVKRTAITLFEKAWREGDFRACSQNLCDEAIVFVQDGNKMAAKSGYHDDEVMACAIGWYVIETDQIGAPGHYSAGQKLGSAKMGAF